MTLQGRTVGLAASMAFWGDSVRPAIDLVEHGEIAVAPELRT